MATLEGVTALVHKARVKVFQAGHALVDVARIPFGPGQYPDWKTPSEELEKLDRLVHRLEGSPGAAQHGDRLEGQWDHLED